jgi:4-amino-4-deoxy-L-arabinose transferase-like glycosyltransferase
MALGESGGSSLWRAVLAVALWAAVLRALFYPGYFGSDEVTYVESAFKLLHGDWSVDSYVGANRYGVNLPIAAFGWLFGQNEFAAALYSLLCSIGEVALVTAFGIRMFGSRAGVLAGLLLACVPVHVHYAGRLMADAPLGLAITASFLFFWYGEARHSRLGYLLAGCAAGASFWIKPAVIFYVLVLLLYPIVFRRLERRWVWTVAGFVVVVLANNVFFWAVTGRFWFLFDAIRERQTSGYLQDGGASGAIVDAVDYYLVYLFGKLYQTWLVGYLALACCVWWVIKGRQRGADSRFALRFTLWWAAGLIALMSLLVVSWRPIMFIPKQTNYMLVFVAPLCLLAGVALAQLSGRAFAGACAVVIIPSLALGLLQQASVQVFTANSKATVEYARTHPDARLYVTTNADRAAQFYALVHPRAARLDVQPLQGLLPPHPTQMRERLAVIDTETLGWGSKEAFRHLDEVPRCWEEVDRLHPLGLGAGAAIARTVASIAATLPEPLAKPLKLRLEHLAEPAPAFVYRVPDQPCGTSAARN